jgi:hypothetical protein
MMVFTILLKEFSSLGMTFETGKHKDKEGKTL